MDRKRTAILEHDVAKLRKGPSLGKPEDLERHVPDEPRRHGTGEIRQTWLRPLVIERFVRDGRVKQRMKAPMEISERLNTLAGTGRRQREAQAKWGNGPLPAAKLHVFATRVEQRFGKDPLELVRDGYPRKTGHFIASIT